MKTATDKRPKTDMSKTPDARLREKGLRLSTAPVEGFMTGHDWAGDTNFAALQADMTTREVEYAKARVLRPRKALAWALSYVCPDMGYDAAKSAAHILERDPKVQAMMEYLREIHGAAAADDAAETGNIPVDIAEILTALDGLFREAVRAGDTESVLTLGERIVRYRDFMANDDPYSFPPLMRDRK